MEMCSDTHGRWEIHRQRILRFLCEPVFALILVSPSFALYVSEKLINFGYDCRFSIPKTNLTFFSSFGCSQFAGAYAAQDTYTNTYIYEPKTPAWNKFLILDCVNQWFYSTLGRHRFTHTMRWGKEKTPDKFISHSSFCRPFKMGYNCQRKYKKRKMCRK